MRRVCFWAFSFICVAAASAAEPVAVVPRDAIAQPRQPQAAVTSEGKVFVTFGAGESIYCCVSQDGGQSFGKPVEVASVKGLALGKRRGPRIAATAECAVITAISHPAGDLMSWRSTDGGRSWSGPVTINDQPTVAREGLHALACGPRGELYCTWLDLRNKKMEIAGASSADGGVTWSTNQLIYHSPSGAVCECCHPSATFDSSGRLFVMWRNSLDGNRDMYLTTSTDLGKTFSTATKLGTGNWKLNACPMDGGALVAINGSATTIWRRDRQVFTAASIQKDEQNLGTGEQPWAAATSEGPYLVWVTRRGGDLWLQRSSEAKPIKLAANASDPVIAAPLAAAGPIVAVWETGQGKDVSILAEVVGHNAR